MLPKKNRLIKEKDFNRIHKFGNFTGESFLAIKFQRNNLEVSRFGFLVGTKISKKAVTRNLVKRRLRENIHLKLNNIKPGFDIIFLTKPEIVGKSYDEINKAIRNVLGKSNLFADNF
jgi:ribonuclease P protein component